MWYVVETHTGQEESTSRKCRAAMPPGTCRDVFVPMYVCMKRYQGVWHQENHVLFPGYFFLDTDEPDTVEGALEPLSRIAKPVLSGDDFAPVWPEEQNFLEGLMDSQHTVQMSEGDIVNGEFNIYQGPLKEKHRYLRRIDRHKRLAEMEVRLLGQNRRVLVGLEVVRKS